MKKVWIWATLLLVLSCNDSTSVTALEELLVLSQSPEVQRQLFASKMGYEVINEVSGATIYGKDNEKLIFRDNEEVVYETGEEDLYLLKLRELKALGVTEPQKEMIIGGQKHDIYLLSDSISVFININQQHIASELLKYIFVIRNLKSFEEN